MNKIIRRYYLFSFLGFFVLFLITYLPRKSPNNTWINVLICLGGALLISVICGTIYYLQDTKWGPAKRKKRMDKSPFLEFYDYGFTRMEDYARGNIDGYEVLVMYAWWPGGKPAVRIDVLFDMGPATKDSSMSHINHLSKRIKSPNGWHDPMYEWNRNSLGVVYSYTFSPPSFKRLMKKINELIEVLKREGLSPMNIGEAIHVSIPGEKNSEGK